MNLRRTCPIQPASDGLLFAGLGPLVLASALLCQSNEFASAKPTTEGGAGAIAVARASEGASARSPGVVGQAPASAAPTEFTDEELAKILTLQLGELPPDPTNRYADDPRAARFGQGLFYDVRLSGSGNVACATCHVPERGFAEEKQVASTPNGQLQRHTMSLWNVAYNRWFFWDGRSDSLWSQALGPLEDPREHAGTRLGYAHQLARVREWKEAYEEVFGALPDFTDRQRFPEQGRPVPEDSEHEHARAWAGMRPADQDAVNRVFANLGKSLAAFERKLISRRSPFDRFVEGLHQEDGVAREEYPADARRGLKLFLGKARCHLCHSGPSFSDLEFHHTRVRPLEGGTETDPGRYVGIQRVRDDPFNGLGIYSDERDGAARDKVGYLKRVSTNLSEFKTPSLRNVALSAPYMHAGQMATLDQVVQFYSTMERALPGHKRPDPLLQPIGLSEAERNDLVAFLRTLTDDGIDPALLRAPE